MQSLPRLELCGALLLVRLVAHLTNNLSHSPRSVHLWTDSKVVLDWLKGHPSKWNTFVANRVSEIQTTLPSAHWRHVSSADNPADAASRGLCAEQLLAHDLWWQGPKWLANHEAQLPTVSDGSLEDDDTLQALIATEAINPVSEVSTEDRVYVLTLLANYSSFNKITRILGWCLRWRQKNCKSFLTAEDRSAGRRSLFLMIQTPFLCRARPA